MCLKVLLEDAARLDEQAAIDRLVRHLVSLIIGIGVLEPSRNLLRRPVLFQPGSDQLPQLFMHRQLARLRPKRSIPGPPVRDCGTIPSTTAIAPELAVHCRWRPPRLAAIDRKDMPTAIPRETSSRSARLSARRDRRRGAGQIPPCGFRCAKIAPDVLSNTRPISFSPSPRCQRSQTSALSAAVNKRRTRLFVIAHLTSH
jgi:hypothetical protein